MLPRKGKWVLDTGAILNLPSPPTPAVTVAEVVEEVKEPKKRALLESLLGEEIKLMEPSKESIEQVKKVCKETGDRLSETDVKILALALDVGGVLYTDDFAVQNVARHLGIPFVGVERIRERRRWKKVCPVCGREYPWETKVCPRCGVKLLPKLDRF